MTTKPADEPEALRVYRRTLGEAADNHATILTEELSAETWIEELETWRADDPSSEQLREAFDFAKASQLLDADDTEVEYVDQTGFGRHGDKRRGTARARNPWDRAFGSAG